MPIRFTGKTITLAVAGLLAAGILVSAMVFLIRAWWATPIPVLGMGSAPEQPIDFPHTTHAQAAPDGLGIECRFCHRNVAKGDAATVPAVEQCMFCHETVVGQDSPEIAKLREYAASERAIDWDRVHRVPDHVQFAHEPHIRVFTDPNGQRDVQREVRARAESEGTGLLQAACSICHGKVWEMTRVEQVRSLKMGDCVDCHSKNEAPTDCATCHY